MDTNDYAIGRPPFSLCAKNSQLIGFTARKSTPKSAVIFFSQIFVFILREAAEDFGG